MPYPALLQTSKMDYFAAIFNSFQPIDLSEFVSRLEEKLFKDADVLKQKIALNSRFLNVLNQLSKFREWQAILIRANNKV